MEREDHDELLRCRERLHTLEGKVVALDLLVADLREWRAQIRVQVEQNSKRIDGLVKADEIADAVAAKLREERIDGVTFGNLNMARWQTWAAAVGVLLLVAAPYITRFAL